MKGYTIQDEISRWRQPYGIYGAKELSNVAQDKFDVNSTISEIDDVEDANIEAEAGEILLNSEGKVFKILGKPHSKGGTPLNVPEGSFIYSKFKPLAIDKESKELFNLKEGGKYTRSKNVPAKILEREIDINHHNKLFKVMDSKFHDKLSKTSAEAMLQKNFTKLGQIAYLQEEVKGFPNGLPEFSMGTAPVDNEETHENIEEMNQYKRGGKFIPLAQKGLNYKNKTYNYTDQVPEGAEFLERVNIDGNDRWLFRKNSMSSGQAPASVRSRKSGYNTAQELWDMRPDLRQFSAEELIQKGYGNAANPTWKDWKQQGSGQEELFYTGYDGEQPYPSNVPKPNSWNFTSPKSTLPVSTPGNEKLYNPQNNPNNPEMELEDILPYNPQVPFTKDQLLDQGWAAFQATNINKYYPLRKQYNFTEFTPQEINTQPYIDNIRSQGSSFMQNQRTIDPRLARGNNSYAFGQMLASGNEALGQVYNQKVGINNQANQFNVQGRNAVNAQNIDAASQYYDGVNMTDQNYDNEVRFAQNQFRSLRNQQKSQNDAMQQNLTMQPAMGERDVWINPRTGKQSFTERVGWTKKKIAAPLYDRDPRTGQVYYTGAGTLDMAGGKDIDSWQRLDMFLNNPNYDVGVKRAFALSAGRGLFPANQKSFQQNTRPF